MRRWSAMNPALGRCEHRTTTHNAAGTGSFRRRRDSDKTLYRLTNELIAVRVRAGLTQQEVGRRMGTTKSAISRLERGLVHRPTLTTIENYALVVGCRIDIHLLPWP
jgi:DNA-binding XRE family transcriptional regulator